jgi:DNA primase
VEVVAGYTSLRKRGATYEGLCPFHKEKTPSFKVSADKGLYYCFGCGEGGDVVRFVERMENLSFAEAVEQLGDRFGVPVEFEEGAAVDPSHRDREGRLLLLLEKAAAFYERYLWETESGRVAREYLERRGLRPEVCKVFRVGYSPDEWRGIHRRAVKEGFTDRELEEAGLVIRQPGKIYDRFRGRLMFPLIDHRGRVVGFGGRTLKDETPKYLNSPEGPLYQKGHLLYGLYQARRAIAEHDEVVVVEGYTDVLGLVQAGVTNVVASMGTALTEAQVGLMTRFTANLTFMFDADRAGTEAMLRSGELARQHGLRPMMAVLPKDSDPADVASKGGVDGVAKVVAGKMSLLGFELRQALDRSDTSTSEGRVRAFEAVRAIMAKASSLKEREEEIAFVADRLRLTPESAALLLREQATRVSRNRTAGRTGSEVTSGRGSRAPSGGRLFNREASIERDFLVAAGCNPEHALTLLETLTPEHFTDSSNREVFEGLLDALKLMKESADQAAVLAKLRAQAHGDSEAGRLFVRLILEADQERYSTAVLDELHLRLQEAYFMRAIIRQRALLEEESDVEVHQRRLLQLERLLQSVRIGLKNLDPEEGQG